jgi:hypothetical protein
MGIRVLFSGFPSVAKDRGIKILPVVISPCLYEETRFKYPDWKTGPHELLLGSLQSINPPSRILVEMTEGEQNRVLLAVARQLGLWLEEEKAAEEDMKTKRHAKNVLSTWSNSCIKLKKRPLLKRASMSS